VLCFVFGCKGKHIFQLQKHFSTKNCILKSFFYKFIEKTTEMKSTITFFDTLFGYVLHFLGDNAFTFGFIHYLCEQNTLLI